MNAVLGAVAMMLIAVFAAAFAAPYVVDWNEYRTVFEAQASKLAGRPVRVEGDVGLTILPVPEVRFRKVSIADASGDFEKPSATARAFRIRLSIPPLLRGEIEARKIELDRLALRLGLDENGQVIWPRLGDVADGLPFVPADVSLKSVSLNEASLEIASADAPARWRVEGVSGELSAESLRGPFRFAGRAVIGEDARDVQLSIGRMDGDGAMPVKFVSRADHAVYRADGKLRALDGGPEFAGQVSASAPDAAPDTQPPWQAEASASATLERAALSDLKITIVRAQRPQTLEGAAQASWLRGLQFDAQLTARWLDLDLLAGPQLAGQAPAQALLRLPALLGDLPLPGEQVRIALDVAQVNLGGDTIRDLGLVARRTDGRWGVERLDAGLPGGSDIGFEGRFTRGQGGSVLAGTVRVSGSHLARLLAWAAPGRIDADAAGSQAFSLGADVESGAERVSLTDISARLGETRLSGALGFTRGEKPGVSVDLDARALDLRPYLSKGTAGALTGLISGEAEAPLPELAGADWQIHLRADRLVLPELSAADFAARLRLTGSELDIETLSLRGRDGLRVGLAGRYPRGQHASGATLNASFAADSAEAVADVARLVPDGAAWASANRSRLRAATPIALSASLRPAAAGDGAWLRIDGQAAQTSLRADARLHADGRHHVFARADSPRLSPLLGQLSPGLEQWVSGDDVPGASRASADFEGSADAPWRGTARIEADGIEVAFDGLADPRGGAQALQGTFSLHAEDADRALELAGLPPPRARAGSSAGLRLDAQVSGGDALYSVRNLDMSLGGQPVTGEARFDLSSDKPAVDVRLSAAQFSLPAAAALLIERPPIVVPGLDGAFWPDEPFAAGALSRISGRLAVAADELVISEGLSVGGAALDARIEDGALRLSSLSGRVFGGALSGSAMLRGERGRTVFEGEAAIEDLDLAQLPHGSGEPLASGTATLEVSVSSEGLTPRGLVTVMSGSGRIALSPGEIRGLDPSVLEKVARNHLDAEQQPDETAAQRLAAPLGDSRLAHQGAQAALAIRDGALRLARTTLHRSSAGHSVAAEARLDLIDMTLAGTFALSASLDGVEALPVVRVSLSGPMSEFGAISPRIGGSEYDQFLTVKRLERNVERLEELERGRIPPDPAAPGAAAPPASHGAQAPATLGGFSTEIERAPEAARRDAPPVMPRVPEAEAQPPAAASITPGRPLDDPQVVEDARRELMRQTPRQRRPEAGGLFEIFRN